MTNPENERLLKRPFSPNDQSIGSVSSPINITQRAQSMFIASPAILVDEIDQENNIGKSSARKLTTFFSKSTSPYDSPGAAETHGMRYRYDDYTTIDFIHDTIKDRIRHRNLTLKGSRFVTTFDSFQAWAILAIVGIISGIIACISDYFGPILNSIRLGYCKSGIHKISINCRSNEWVSWKSTFGLTGELLIYISTGLLFAGLSVGIVSVGPTHKTRDRPFVESTVGNEYLIDRTLYHAAGSGIPEVKTILGGFVIREFLGLRTLLTKIVALIFSVGSGLMVGVQGPLVHISTCCGNIGSRFCQKYRENDGKRREIMSACCAAGVSVAFGAPIGGVLFSLEEASYYFPLKTMWRSFFCALIGAFTIKVIDPLGTGKLVRFAVDYDGDFRLVETFGFLIIGVFGGLLGAGFIKLTSILELKKKSLRGKYYAVYLVLIISVFTSLLSFFSPYTRLSNIFLVSELFKECKSLDSMENGLLCGWSDLTQMLAELGWTLVVKSILMVITFGIRIPGGIFLPSMVVGAIIGRIIGELIQAFIGNLTVIPGVYAMVGAASVLSGVTRMTVSLTVIMFELTGNLNYVLPLMSAIMSAKWIADIFGRDSIYDVQIAHKGYPYLSNKIRGDFGKKLLAKDLMEPSQDLIDSNQIYRLNDIREMMKRLYSAHPSFDGGFPVIKGRRILVGYISHNDLKHAMENIDPVSFNSIVFQKVNSEDVFNDYNLSTMGPDIASNRITDLSPWVDKTPITVSTTCSAEMVLELFLKLGMRSLLVVKDGIYQGTIHKKQLLYFMSKSRGEIHEQYI